MRRRKWHGGFRAELRDKKREIETVDTRDQEDSREGRQGDTEDDG